MEDDKDSLKQRLVDIFLNDAPKVLERLKREAIDNKQIEFQRTIHDFAAFARQISATELLEVVQRAESYSREPNMPEAVKLLPDIEHAFWNAFHEVSKSGVNKRLETIEERMSSLEKVQQKLIAAFTSEMEGFRSTMSAEMAATRATFQGLGEVLTKAIKTGISEGMTEIRAVTNSMIPLSLFMKVLGIVIGIFLLGLGVKSLPMIVGAFHG